MGGRSKQIPAAIPLSRRSSSRGATCAFSVHVASVQLPDPFDLLQSELQKFLLADDVEMAPDPRVLSGEALDFCIGQVPAKSHVQLAGKVVVEFGEKFDVEEEDRGRGQLVRYYVEEDFGAVVFVFLG